MKKPKGVKYMRITEQRLKKLEKEANKTYNPVEIPPIIWDSCKRLHPELTDEEIDELYRKAGVKPIKIILAEIASDDEIRTFEEKISDNQKNK